MFITRHSPLFLFSTGEESGAGQAPDVQGTPDVPNEPVGEQQTQAEIDWQKRYGDLQPEYTRATQEAAELRRERELYQQMLTAEDVATRQKAADALGYELPEEDDPNQDQQFLTREEWQAYQDQQAQLAQQQKDEQGVKQIEQYMDDQLSTLGVPEYLQQIVKADAVFNRDPDESGRPDIKGAYDHFLNEVRVQDQKQWSKTKRTRHTSAGGAEGTQAPDLSTHAGRVQHMLSQLQADE